MYSVWFCPDVVNWDWLYSVVNLLGSVPSGPSLGGMGADYRVLSRSRQLGTLLETSIWLVRLASTVQQPLERGQFADVGKLPVIFVDREIGVSIRVNLTRLGGT